MLQMEPVVYKRKIKEGIFQNCTIYIKTNTFKNSLKLRKSFYPLTSLIREDILIVFFTDTAEWGKTDIHLKEIWGERR